MIKLLENYKIVKKKIKEDNLSEYAAECAYFTILSFIPFIIFFLELVKLTNIEKETIYYVIKNVFPTTINSAIILVIEEIYLKSASKISIISALLTLWSAGKGFFSLCKGLRKIYKVNHRNRSIFIRIESTIYTLIFIVAMIFFLLILVFGNKICNIISYKYVSTIILYLLKIRFIILIPTIYLVLLMIYKFIPQNKLEIGTQKYGALFATIVWCLLSYCFSIYMELFKNFENLYGSMTSIILIMIWVYVCMYIILLGGEINCLINKTKNIEQN